MEEKKNILWLEYAIGFFIGGIGMILCFMWFDWKLLLVLALLMWGNNIVEKQTK